MQEFETLLEADQNDPEVQYQIGMCYLHGKGIGQDGTEAEKWFSRAAEKGHAKAKELLQSVRRKQSASLETLCLQSLPDWCLAAEEGDAEAQYQVGKWFLQDSETTEEGKRYLNMAVEQGHPHACLALAEQMMGEGAYGQAVELLRNAADCGLEQAAYELGCCYIEGRGVEQDPEKAERYLLQAARVGGGEAMLDVALRYTLGDGLPQKPALGLAWLQRAQDAGVERAKEYYEQKVSEFHHRKEEERRQEQLLQEERCRQEQLLQEERRRQEQLLQERHRQEQLAQERSVQTEQMQKQEKYRNDSLQQEKRNQQEEMKWREEFEKQEKARREKAKREQEALRRQQEQKQQDAAQKKQYLRMLKGRFQQSFGLFGPAAFIIVMINTFFLGDALTWLWDDGLLFIFKSETLAGVVAYAIIFACVFSTLFSPALLFWGVRKMDENDCHTWFFGLKRSKVVIFGLGMFVLCVLVIAYGVAKSFSTALLALGILSVINHLVMRMFLLTYRV